jgi:HPt (histidine-containing phosphotransfer) domain-containing protein
MYTFNLLKEYHTELGKNFVLELTKTFLENSPEKFKTLHQCIQDNDSETFSRTAHSLKSSAKTFDAHLLADICYTLEKDSKTEPLSTLEPIIDQAEKEYIIFKQALKKFLIDKYQ